MDLLHISIFILGITVIIINFLLLRILFDNRLTIIKRIKEITYYKQNTIEEDPYSLPFQERILIPIFKKVESSIMKVTPQSLKFKEQQLLKLAGYPHHLTIQEWMTWRMVIWFSIGGLLTFVTFYQEQWLHKILIAALGWILGYLVPIMYLKKKKDERKSEIERGLPYVLDILTVSVEAGLGFDSALVKVIEKTSGTVSDEFNKTLQEIKMGKTRKDALRDLGERTGVDDMIQFVGSIIQAEQLGVRIGNVLRVQSEDMRQKRKQRAEEKAMKAPIKILFPLILFIFPAIFIIILGPAVINIMNDFIN